MTPIAYLKLQAKNLYHDYKTQASRPDEEEHDLVLYDYDPTYFDVGSILFDYEYILEECHWKEDELMLGNFQHIFAVMLGFKKWADLVNASEAELELAKLRFDNQHKISLIEWETIIEDTEADLRLKHNAYLDAQGRLDYFKHGLAHNDGPPAIGCDYRLKITSPSRP